MLSQLKIIRQIVVVVAISTMVVVNFLTNIIPLNGRTTGEVFDSYHTFFIPAGYAFLIWGLIYLGLIGFAFYQFQKSKKNDLWMNLLGIWIVISCAANILWIVLWHYNRPALALVAMFVLLISLVEIYLRFEIGKFKEGTTSTSRLQTMLFVHLPFSLYLGWITVMTISNIAVVLYVNNWDWFSLGAEAWTAVMLIIATVITSLVITYRRDVAFALVVVWAFIGITVKFYNIEIISWTAGLMSAVILGVLMLQPLVSGKKKTL